VSTGRGHLSERQWADVVAARAELDKLSAALARRCPRMQPDEIATIGEDVLMEQVPRWDRNGEISLVGYALRRIRRAVYGASAKRAGRSAARAVGAMKAHGASVEPLSLSELTQLSQEQILERARELGCDLITVGYAAHTIDHPKAVSSPEELLNAEEQRAQLWSAVEEAGPEAAALYRLMYEQDHTLEEAAASLGTNVFAAKRLHARARKQLRAILARKRR
jgi:RNA polymerase sigma factor (sigma-70 family)